MANSRTPGELKNYKLENPSSLSGPLAQYLGSDKRWVLSPCIKNMFISAKSPLWKVFSCHILTSTALSLNTDPWYIFSYKFREKMPHPNHVPGWQH